MLRTRRSWGKSPRGGFSLTSCTPPDIFLPHKPLESKEIHTFVTRRQRFGTTLFFAALLLGAAAPAFAAEGVIIQESNGFPGGEKARLLSRQKVSVKDGKLRVLDPNHGWALFVSLPEQRVREASLEKGEYEERGFEHYQRYREDLARSRQRTKEQFTKLRQRAEGDPAKLREIVEEYRKAGGDPEQPGRLVVTLQPVGGETKEQTLQVDLEPRQVVLERWQVRENQAEHPTLDLWVAKDLDLGIDLLAFWRALVPFPEEVSAKLGEVKGAVIGLEATVDTGTFRRTFVSRILEIRTPGCEPVEAKDLEIPARWKKVDPAAAREAESATVVCAMTGEEIPRDGAETRTYRDPRSGRVYRVKKDKLAELIKLTAKGEKPPFADAKQAADEGGPR